MLAIDQYMKMSAGAVDAVCPRNQTPAGLYAPITYGLSVGGKRLRPTLVLAACDAVGGNSADALSQAAAIEMFHNFTLLHDDVMDNADVRRGKPSVRCKWNDNTAILSGDAMLTLATQLIVKDLNPEKAVAILSVFNEMAMGVYEGQQYDVDFENRDDVHVDEYIEMIRLKTSVLLGGACQIGAIIGNASIERQKALYDFAMNLGIAFQLQDDWLDVYGDPKIFGKSIGGDIINNKKTFLLISAMKNANPEDRKELQYWLNSKDPLPGEKIVGVTAIYNRLKVDEICKSTISHYNNKALEALRIGNFSQDAIDFFIAFNEMVMQRNK